MRISVNELLKKNKENPAKITQLINEINTLTETVQNLTIEIEQIKKDIEILKEGDNI